METEQETAANDARRLRKMIGQPGCPTRSFLGKTKVWLVQTCGGAVRRRIIVDINLLTTLNFNNNVNSLRSKGIACFGFFRLYGGLSDQLGQSVSRSVRARCIQVMMTRGGEDAICDDLISAVQEACSKWTSRGRGKTRKRSGSNAKKKREQRKQKSTCLEWQQRRATGGVAGAMIKSCQKGTTDYWIRRMMPSTWKW